LRNVPERLYTDKTSTTFLFSIAKMDPINAHTKRRDKLSSSDINEYLEAGKPTRL